MGFEIKRSTSNAQHPTLPPVGLTPVPISTSVWRVLLIPSAWTFDSKPTGAGNMTTESLRSILAYSGRLDRCSATMRKRQWIYHFVFGRASFELTGRRDEIWSVAVPPSADPT